MSDTPSESTGLNVSTCDKCGQTDDHPRHTQYVAFNHPVTGEATDLSVSKHIDCCAEDGCPLCSLDVQHALPSSIGGEGQMPHGETMREFLLNRPDELLRAQFEQNAVETPDYQFPDTSPSQQEEVTNNG